MLKCIVFIIISTVNIYSSKQIFAQDSLETDIKTMHYLVKKFLGEDDRVNTLRKSEVILMLIETDTNGSVASIRLLADSKNIDSTFTKIEKMKPEDFGGYRFISLKDKVINLPLYSLTGDTYDPKNRYLEKSIVDCRNITAKRGGVMARPLYYLPLIYSSH